MHRGVSEARRIILLLSRSYFKSIFCQPEWAAAVSRDPTGSARVLLPIRIEQCNVSGLLKSIVYIDLAGLKESEAKQRLLFSLQDHPRTPQTESPFTEATPDPVFPGSTLSPDKFSERKAKEISDGMTTLDTIPQRLNSGQHSDSIIIFDVDNMSGINNKYKAKVGDEVLIQLRKLAENYFGSAVLGRCGDDTYFVVLNLPAAKALSRLKRFSTLVKRHDWSDTISPGLYVSVSGSVAEFGERESPADTALRAALGCRDAKRRGLAQSIAAPAVLGQSVRDLFERSGLVLSERIAWVHSS